jgi:hypothetical protein
MPLLQNKLVLAIAFTLFLAACSNSAQQESATQDQTTAEAEKKPSAEEQSLDQVVDQYLLLKDALVASNPEEVQSKATSMLEVIDATNMMGIQQSAKQIAAATDLETQRAYFDSLSIHVYEHLEAQNQGEKTIYKQYCPMAFDNRGAFWLSNAQEIRNPYFGDEMLTCGRVEETLEY